MSLNVKTLMVDFLTNEVAKGKVEVYNEFSLQHELGIYLRDQLKNNPDYKVQFERNTKYFGFDLKDPEYEEEGKPKHEIDIAIFNADKSEKYAIELKYPRNGQYPETMYSFCKDIKFMEQCKQNGFDETFCLTLVDVGKGRYKDAEKSGNPFFSKPLKQNNKYKSYIYEFFRADMFENNPELEKEFSAKKPIRCDNDEQIKKPTKSTKTKEEFISFSNNKYLVNWQPCGEFNKYYIIEAKQPDN
ncbi:hypothetical protein J5690_06240 [bacterium]|nr:hypothetical protein [bacterium]